MKQVHTSSGFLIVALMLALLMAGCDSLLAPEVRESEDREENTLRLIVKNDYAYAITELYASPCSSPTWGTNQLGSGTMINPDSERAFEIAPAGCYDLHAVASNGQSATSWDVQINGPFRWTVSH